MAFQQPVHRGPSLSASADHKNAIASVDGQSNCSLASAAIKQTPETLKTATGICPSVIDVPQQLELFAKRQCPRIAVKVNSKIVFMEISDITAAHAEGNYTSLEYRSSPYLLRECLRSIALKLKPYGFIRIHRSVLVNASLVDEVWPLSTGEYRLRVRNGREYVVTRRYKDNLRHVAYVWLGSGFCNSSPARTEER